MISSWLRTSLHFLPAACAVASAIYLYSVHILDVDTIANGFAQSCRDEEKNSDEMICQPTNFIHISVVLYATTMVLIDRIKNFSANWIPFDVHLMRHSCDWAEIEHGFEICNSISSFSEIKRLLWSRIRLMPHRPGYVGLNRFCRWINRNTNSTNEHWTRALYVDCFVCVIHRELCIERNNNKKILETVKGGDWVLDKKTESCSQATFNISILIW